MEPTVSAADPRDLPIHPPPPRRKVAAAVAGLTAFGFSLPLVRVLADAPEFFVAHHLSRGGTLLYWAVVTLVVPGVLALVALLPGSAGDSTRTVLLALLGGLAAASILQVVSGRPAVFTVGLLAAAIAVPYAVRRSSSFLDVLAVSSVGCLLLAGFVVGPSRTGAYVRSGSATAVRSQAQGELGPVVVIVFDEFPISALLGSDLRINRDRYPNFAALADTSDWFRSAASVSPNTAVSVPALLSGIEPVPGRVPVASAYPSNLFLQLATRYEARAFESLSALCPPSVCESVTPSAGRSASRATLSGLLDDSSVVLRHAIATDDQRRHLPSISGSWSSFAEQADVVGASAEHDGSGRELVFDRGTFSRETGALVDLAGTAGRTHRPQLRVAHVTAPHAPWLTTPTGESYAYTEPQGSEVVDSLLHWTQPEQGRRTGYQRMLLQIGALDAVLGQTRKALEDQGIWDDATVVVTADHGTQFEPGYFRDERVGGVEVTGVPFFVKRAGQERGRIDDRAALTIDLVPTVLGQIGLRSPSRFDGIDLYHDEVPKVRTDAFVTRDHGRTTPDQRVRSLRALVERRASWVDPDGGWSAAYQPGVATAVVGKPTAAVGEPGGPGATWHRQDGQTGPMVTLDVAPRSGHRPVTLLLSCGDEVVGAVPVAPTQSLQGIQAFVTSDHCAGGALTVASVDAAGVRDDAGPSLGSR